MIDPDIIDVAIGVVFLFLVISLMCSAINEMLEAFLKNRAKDLERGIQELLSDNQETDDVVRKLYSHPLINGLYQGTYDTAAKSRKLPSYVPATTFAIALLDLFDASQKSKSDSAPVAAVAPAKVGGAAPDAVQRDESTNDASPTDVIGVSIAAKGAEVHAPSAHLPENTSKAIQLLIDTAENDATRARKNIEDWYNASMDRVSGWYKRRTQFILFGLGLLLAVVINADAIGFTKFLSTSKEARDIIVAHAKALPSPKVGNEAGGRDTPTPAQLIDSLGWLKAQAGLPFGWRTWPSEPTAPPAPMPAASSKVAAQDIIVLQHCDDTFPAHGLTKEQTDFESACARFGREKKDYEHDWRKFPGKDGWEWLSKLVGLSLTGIAVSFGAPFWFDVLNKFMIVRSTVKPEEKSPQETSKS